MPSLWSVRIPDALPVDDGHPHDLPMSWQWVRLGNLGGFLGGGTPSKSNAEFWKGSVPWVSPKDMKRPYISDAEDHISEAAVEQSSTKIIPVGSLLFVVRGMILAHSFPTALTTARVAMNQDMKALVLAVPELPENMFFFACRAARMRVLGRVVSGHHTEPADWIRTTSMGFLVPLAPLAEQKRIVAKVEQLMALCDAMETRLAKQRDKAVRLNKAALAELTNAEGVEAFALSWQRVATDFETLFNSPEDVSQLQTRVSPF